MKEENNIEKLFRDSFENFEVIPPVSVKAEIDKQLGTARKRRFLFWWFVVAVLLLSGMVFAVSELSDTDADITSSGSQKGSSITGKGAHGFVENREEEVAQKLPAIEGKQLQETGNDSLKENPPERSEAKTNSKTQWNRRAGKNQVVKETVEKRIASSKSAKKETSIQTKKTRQKSAFSKKTGKPTGKSASSVRLKDEREANKEIGEGPADHKTDIQKNETVFLANVKIPSDSLTTVGEKVEKNDSVPASVQTPDSVQNEKPQKDARAASNWMVEVFGGPRFGLRTSKSDFTLKDANSWQIGLGFSRSINLGPLKYVTLEGEYGSGKENYTSETQTESVYFVGIDSIPYFDSITGSVIGYDTVSNYDTLINTIQIKSGAVVSRFAFGLSTQFNFNLKNGFGIALAPGYYYSRNKYRFSESSGAGTSTGSSSSSQIRLNIGLYYDWNRFRFRIGLDSRYEWMGKNQSLFVDRRKSLLFTPQIGIGFKF